MESTKLRRSLFGYSRKGVRQLVAEREAMAIKASQDARDANARVEELAAELDHARRDTADLQTRTRDLDAQLKDATQRFRVLDQSSSPSTSEGLTDVLQAAERALGRLTETARRNAEQDLEQTERARDDLRAEIDRLAEWRTRIGPLSETLPQSMEEVRREASAMAVRLRDAMTPLTDAMDLLAARLGDLAEVPAPPDEAAPGVIRLEEAVTRVPEPPAPDPLAWGPRRTSSNSA